MKARAATPKAPAKAPAKAPTQAAARARAKAPLGDDGPLLVLGSFPGTASLAAQQYYAHPRNHFWPILGALWGLHDLARQSYAQRCAALLDHGLGLWDVHAACRREGSLDSAIREARPNDLPGLARQLPQLAAIAHNGGESARARRVTEALGLPVYRLPSTSPANASWSFERKRAAWAQVLSAHGLCPPDPPPSAPR